MLSKSTIKHIQSLSQKKFRDDSNEFVAEGTKLVLDLLPSFENVHLVSTNEWFKQYAHNVSQRVDLVTESELCKISNQKTPQGVFAVFKKRISAWDFQQLSGKLSIALDGVQDPGNIGTIVRVADWFGIRDVFCSETTADIYGPKAVQATMGTLVRVNVHTVNMVEFLKECREIMPVYGTFMDGKDLYQSSITQNGMLVFGNEGNGISAEVEEIVNQKLLIPNYPPESQTTDSLNVGVASALVCAEFRRRFL